MGKSKHNGAFFDDIQTKRFRECVDDVKAGRSSIKGLKRNYQIQAAMRMGDNGGKGEAISRVLNGHKKLSADFAQNFIDSCYPELHLSYLLGRSNQKYEISLEDGLFDRDKYAVPAFFQLLLAAGATNIRDTHNGMVVDGVDILKGKIDIDSIDLAVDYYGETIYIPIPDVIELNKMLLHTVQGTLLRMLHISKALDRGEGPRSLEFLNIV